MRKGNVAIKLAKDAPAPKETRTAGKAQHISVEEDAIKDMKLTEELFIIIFIGSYVKNL